MKQLIVILALSICFASCKKQSNTPAPTNNTPPSSTSTLTITVNSATITSGQSVTLTANGATTYSWSTGATTNSITVSPTSTTSYTVTGTTGSNTGTATAVVTVSTGTATVSDSVFIKVTLEAPQSTTFNYHYDTTNIRVLLNGHRMLSNKFNLYKDLAMYGSPLTGFTNFITAVGTDRNMPIHMNSGDSITVEIDSLYYTSGNPYRGGSIYINVNAVASTSSNVANPKIYDLANNPAPPTYNPIGRAMGNAPANGQGGSTQNFYWYLGGKFRYTWVKP